MRQSEDSPLPGTGDARIERAQRIEAAARAVVDAAPGYTAKGGSLWLLDHKLDELREVLDAV